MCDKIKHAWNNVDRALVEIIVMRLELKYGKRIANSEEVKRLNCLIYDVEKYYKSLDKP